LISACFSLAWADCRSACAESRSASHGRNLPLHEVGLARVFGLVLLQRGLRARDRGLGSLDLEPVGLRLDGEQRSALLDVVAVGVADRLDEALHAGDEIDRIDGGHVAGRFEILRDLLLDRGRDRDLRRRRCGIAIVLSAGGENKHGGQKKGCPNGPGFGHRRSLVFKFYARERDESRDTSGGYDPISLALWQDETHPHETTMTAKRASAPRGRR
jgi:hypothetical protein